MNMRQYLRHPSRRLALEAAVGALVWKTGSRFLRKRVAPGLFELAAAADGTHTDALELLARASGVGGRVAVDDALLASLREEFEEHRTELADRYRSQELRFPRSWGVEGGTSFLLYGLARILRPEVLVELGVANGHSSYFLLRALRENGAGRLHSFDIATDVGGLVSGDERDRWELSRLDPHHAPRELADRLAALAPAGLCFHDADHGYLAQYTEYWQLWNRLDDGGVLVSDDVDGSFALIDFADALGREPTLLIDGRKVVGVIARSAGPSQAPDAVSKKS